MTVFLVGLNGIIIPAIIRKLSKNYDNWLVDSNRNIVVKAKTVATSSVTNNKSSFTDTRNTIKNDELGVNLPKAYEGGNIVYYFSKDSFLKATIHSKYLFWYVSIPYFYFSGSLLGLVVSSEGQL